MHAVIARPSMLFAALALSMTVTTLASAQQAAPSTPAERCVAAADRGQLLRDEGKLKASRAELAGCGGEACPTVVRRECIRWLEEISGRIPSVILTPRDASGKDLPSARLVLDGRPVDAAGIGRALELDPGPHTLTAEMPGRERAQESFVLKERKRDRLVTIVLRAPNEGAKPERRVPVLSWILGGVAVAGGVGFGVFWARGMDQVGDLRATCSPYCTQAQIDEVRPQLDIARISGGVGIVAAVSAVAVYFLSSPTPARAGAATPAPGGAALSF